MKKKFLVVGVMILVLITRLTINVSAYEITSAEIVITPSKTEVNPGDKVEFTVSLKNLEADTGLMGVGAYVEYDSNLLELTNEAEGLSGWTDATISSTTNRFATTRNSHSANNEDILKITFTAKNVNSDKETTVGLSQIELSNGSELDISSVVSSAVIIKPKSSVPDNPDQPDNPDEPDNPNTPDTPDEPDNPNTPDNPNKGDNDEDDNNQQNENTVKPGNDNTTGNKVDNSTNNKVNNGNRVSNSTNNNNRNTVKNTIGGGTTNKGNTTSNSNIPNLGANAFLTILIGIAVVVAIILFMRMKLLDKKINKQINNNDNNSDNNDKN